ncbi:MAG: Smr/MutS family protein [Myxococcota bacterium]
MSKKKKSKSKSKKKKKFSHSNPFSKHQNILEKAVKNSEEKIRKEKEKEKKEKARKKREKEEKNFLNRYLEGVKPLDKQNKLEPAPGKKRAPVKSKPEKESFAELFSSSFFDIEFLDEYVYGLNRSVNRKVLNKLKKGDYSYQAHLDLHGYIWEDARELIINFINQSRRRNQRCILIVHGRGLHSPDSVPKLKKGLINLLTRSALSRKILAFATALPVDGGPGAMYILLKK